MITPSAHSLSLVFSNQNKALAEILKQASPEQLLQLKENKDLKSVLTSLFEDKINNTKSDAILLELLKNNPAFKNMGNFTENLKLLLADLKSAPSLISQSEKLTEMIQPTTTIESAILKEKIGNSGVFMESKIALLLNASPSQVEEAMREDIKSQLLAISEQLESIQPHDNDNLQTQIDKLLTQIDYHQLLSHLNDSNSIYFPFAWDELENGSIEFKKNNKQKFYCEINLTLIEYGNLNLFMSLYEGNQLEIQIRTEKPELKTLLESHLSTLRSSLTDSGLIARSIRIHNESECISPSSSAYAPDDTDTLAGSGFEVVV